MLYKWFKLKLKIDQYNILISIMDKLAPLKRKRIKKDMKQPWYDEQLSKEIQLKQLKERKWKQSGNEYDYIALQYQEACLQSHPC